MSDDFDIVKFMNQNWMNSIKKRSSPTVDLSWLNAGAWDTPAFGFTTERPLRRPPPIVNFSPPPIVIRNVRTIPASVFPAQFQAYRRPEPQPPPIAIRKVRPFSRKSRTSSYWQDAGWREEDDCLIGYYRASGEQYKGLVELKNSSYEPYDFYIYSPPDELVLTGHHRFCYHRRDPDYLNKYWIHFSVKPHDIDSGIIQIERDLAEASSN